MNPREEPLVMLMLKFHLSSLWSIVQSWELSLSVPRT